MLPDPKKNYPIAKFTQVILLNDEGYIVESCDTIFSTKNLRQQAIYEHIPFLESIFDSLKQLQPEASPIHFSKVEVPAKFLPGYYDFSFSRAYLEDVKGILWCIFDYTKLYIDLMKYQQRKNELEIHRQLFEIQNQQLKHSSEIHLRNQFFYRYFDTKKAKDFPAQIRELLLSKDNIYDIFPLMDKTNVAEEDVFVNLKNVLDYFSILKEEQELLARHIVESKEKQGIVLAHLVESTLNLIRKYLKYQPTITVSYEDDLTLGYFSNAKLLQQVLFHVLVNFWSQAPHVALELHIALNKEEQLLQLLFTSEIGEKIEYKNEQIIGIVLRTSLIKKLLEAYNGAILPMYDVGATHLRINAQVPC